MKKILVFISLLFLTTSNLYALDADEILKIMEDRGLKYEEAIDILNTIKGEEFLNNYINTGIYIYNDANDDSNACPDCKTPFIKVFKWALYITDDKRKYLLIFKCNNKDCRLCTIASSDYDKEKQAKILPIFYGKISKKDFEEIKNIENKITYKEAVNKIKNFYSNPIKTSRKTIGCLDCGKLTVRDMSNDFDDKETLFVLTCKNKKCKFFTLFKYNTETYLFDCLYCGKYNKLEDVWLENKKNKEKK